MSRAPHVLLMKEKTIDPVDDVYFANRFKKRLISFQEAIEIHREILHPTMLDKPNDTVNLLIACNMETDKKVMFFL